MFFRASFLVATLVALALPSQAVAQEQPQGWRFTIAPYLLLPHMNGTVGVGPIQTKVDADPGDVFSNLQFGAMLAAEAKNDEWAVGFDGLYMDLSKDGEDFSTKFGGYQASIELTGFRKFTSFFEVLAGGRVNMMGSTFTSPAGVELIDESTAWFDPFIGARFTLPNTGKWTVMLRGDVGGFGVGSQFAWQVRPTVAYSFDRHWSVGVAYWALGMDYVSGEIGDGDYFKYDVTSFGPEIGFGYTF
jgi:hypothetical protein